MIFYQEDAVLQEYLALKEEKEKSQRDGGLYPWKAAEIAWRYGKLPPIRTRASNGCWRPTGTGRIKEFSTERRRFRMSMTINRQLPLPSELKAEYPCPRG